MTKIEFRQGYLHKRNGQWFNPTGYYILKRFLCFWYRTEGPFRHIQQAEKKLKQLSHG